MKIKMSAEQVAGLFEFAMPQDLDPTSMEPMKVSRDSAELKLMDGKPGLGKTKSVLDGDRSQIFRVTNYEHPFDDYSGQSTLVLDEFAGQLPFQLLLNVLDRYPCKLPCRFHDTWAGWTTVWIISNKPLERQYQDVEPQVRAALDRRITTNEEFKSNEEFVAIVARAEAEVNEDLAFLETLSVQPDWDEESDGEDCL